MALLQLQTIIVAPEPGSEAAVRSQQAVIYRLVTCLAGAGSLDDLLSSALASSSEVGAALNLYSFAAFQGKTGA